MFDPTSKDTVGYHLFFEPNGEIKTALDTTIASLARQYAGPVFDAHVTLLARIEASGDREVIAKAKQLSDELATFEVSIETVGSEDAYFRALYYKVTREPIVSYHKIASELFNMKPAEVYTPHFSLYYGLVSSEAKQEVITSLQFPASDPILLDSISVYRTPGAVSTWQKIAEFPLRA